MNIVVCVKQIPDPAGPQGLSEDNTLKRDGKLILDESDSYGVEIALQLRDAAGSGEVTLISMSPGEPSGLRTALAMGVDKAIHIRDDSLHGADALSTAKVLAEAIKRAGDYTLVIAATESTDGYTGTVPAQVAELLGLPSLTFAKSIKIEGGKAIAERQTEAGYDVVESSTPAVVTVTSGVVEPRYPSFKGIMDAKKKPMETLTASDLGVELASWGQHITSVVDAPERAAGEKIEDDGEAHLRIVEYLQEQKVV